jgi:hypothetical protein
MKALDWHRWYDCSEQALDCTCYDIEITGFDSIYDSIINRGPDQLHRINCGGFLEHTMSKIILKASMVDSGRDLGTSNCFGFKFIFSTDHNLHQCTLDVSGSCLPNLDSHDVQLPWSISIDMYMQICMLPRKKDLEWLLNDCHAC